METTIQTTDDLSGNSKLYDKNESKTAVDASFGVFIQPFIKNNEKTIRHMVISGGGLAGFTFHGALRELSNKNYWKLENIRTMYGTSVGSLISFILALGYDWSDIDEYFIKRPLNNVFKFTIYSMFDCIQNKGIFGLKPIEDIMTPLFAGKDIPNEITLKEFYDLNGIEIHSFATELNSFELVDISYKTHPHWRVIDTIYCSCSLPVVFLPFFYENKTYCDGGFLSNYPVKQCIENGADPDEILGMYRLQKPSNEVSITNDSNLMDYLVTIMNNTIEKIIIYPNREVIGIECSLPSSMSIEIANNILNNQEERKRLIEFGASFVE
jgi:predicted acylesterase/phospholipase RssA